MLGSVPSSKVWKKQFKCWHNSSGLCWDYKCRKGWTLLVGWSTHLCNWFLRKILLTALGSASIQVSIDHQVVICLAWRSSILSPDIYTVYRMERETSEPNKRDWMITYSKIIFPGWSFIDVWSFAANNNVQKNLIKPLYWLEQMGKSNHNQKSGTTSYDQGDQAPSICNIAPFY